MSPGLCSKAISQPLVSYVFMRDFALKVIDLEEAEGCFIRDYANIFE
jgi:hypothetical protein